MTPRELGFRFPAEWENHQATWLSFPKNLETWEDRFQRIYPAYFQFIDELQKVETVCISIDNENLKKIVQEELDKRNIPSDNVKLYNFKTNDSWCRDHGPSFIINKELNQKAIVNWGYNAWGGKYPPYDSDNEIPKRVAEEFGYKLFDPNAIMEGGSIEVNGAGVLITSKSCLLNKNRNPSLSKAQIESKLKDFYGVETIFWLEEGIVGDDTDGHVDDMTRFVNENTVVTCIETNRMDENYHPLKENLQLLKQMKIGGSSLNIIELPMPDPVIDSGIRLPASYANFYIANKKVIVPTYRCKKDDEALSIISGCFPNRQVIGIDSTEIIWGLGSFHCLSQQEPVL